MPLLIPPSPFFEQFTRKIFSALSFLSFFLSFPLPFFLLTVWNNSPTDFQRGYTRIAARVVRIFRQDPAFSDSRAPSSGDFTNGKTDFRRLVAGQKWRAGNVNSLNERYPKARCIGGRGSWILNTGAKRVTRDCNLRHAPRNFSESESFHVNLRAKMFPS